MRHEQDGFFLEYGIVNAHQCNRRRAPIKGIQSLRGKGLRVLASHMNRGNVPRQIADRLHLVEQVKVTAAHREKLRPFLKFDYSSPGE
jgi:hypothetical protein